MIRWLIRDPALNLMKVNSHKEHYGIQEKIKLTTRVLQSDYTPKESVKIHLVIEDVTEGLDQAREVLTDSIVTQKQGEAYFYWRAKQEGAYRVRVKADVDGADLEAEDLWVVAEDPLEFRNIATQAQVLEWYSQASQGTVLNQSDSWLDLTRKEAKVMKVNRRKDIPLWSQAWVLVVLVLLPSLEWFLRRKWGLL